MNDEGVTFGVVNSRGEYKAKSNFSIKLEVFVEAGLLCDAQKEERWTGKVRADTVSSKQMRRSIFNRYMTFGLFFFGLVFNQALLLHG